MSALSASLPASLLADGLIRAVNAAGGFATVLARGHAQGAALLLVIERRGGEPLAFERVPDPRGEPAWREAARGREAVARFCERQRGFDPDLWIVELDVPDPARFVEGLPALG
jgi:hypothetical protein